ncbi:MAG: hypothetical protein R6W87_12855 [Halospina sp.]
MAPHTLLIDRGKAFSGGDHIAWPRIKRVIAHQWDMDRLDLVWLCFCPPEAVRFNRVGPVYLAHAGEWALTGQLESRCWKLLYPSPLSIRGKAVAVRPDRECPGYWRAPTEWEAINAERVLKHLCQPLTQPDCDRWDGLGRQMLGHERDRELRARTPEELDAVMLEIAQQRLAARPDESQGPWIRQAA